MESITLDSNVEEIERLAAFIDAFAERHELGDETHYHLNVALEELVVNAMKHGHCEPAREAISLALGMDGEKVRIEMWDTGKPFNPLDVPSPDLTGNIAERPVGGLGIHLVRCLMEDITYERREGRNHLSLSKTVKRSGDDD